MTSTHDGDGRKAAAHTLLRARRAHLVRQAQRALLSRLLDAGEATADNVRDAVPLPDGVSPRVFGAAPGELATSGIIAADGYRKSRRPEAHARPVTVWRLRDRDAAFDWLAVNPELPETTEGATAPTAAPSSQLALF